jgi:uncharacterized protein YjbJ (UPF0337 family)
MGTTDKARNTALRAKGQVKEMVGEATNNPRLRRRGKADQLRARIRRFGEKLKTGARR